MAEPTRTSIPLVNGYSPWTHRLALVTVASTGILVFVGGLVTNTGSGLAVPDWPTTFGHNMFLYPFGKMVGGVFYEHTHRLIGSVVGLLTVTLALVLWFTESRASVRWLGAIALVAVIGQGVLGGIRVLVPSVGRQLAIVHGCLAQAFLALTATMALFTSAEWNSQGPRTLVALPTTLTQLGVLTASLVYLQIISGALLTHTGRFLHLHLICAAMVAVHVPLFAVKYLRCSTDRRTVGRLATALFPLLVVQLMLGVASYVARFTSVEIPRAAVLGLALPTVHRLMGGLILALCTVLAFHARRLAGLQASVPERGCIAQQARS